MAKPAQPSALSSQEYDSPLQAALAALDAAKGQKVASNEWAGAVVKGADGKYVYSIPQQGSEEHFNLALTIPKSASLAALYHTHPGVDAQGNNIGQSSDELFSPNDVQVANQLKVPSYIWTGYDGKEREYVPGQTPTVSQWIPGNNDYEDASKGILVAPPAQPTSQSQAPALAAALLAAKAGAGSK